MTANPPRIVGEVDWPAICRYSDHEKFYNDLNGPKTSKMSEQPLKTLQDFPTSKLNTRVRFPSPAPRSSNPLDVGLGEVISDREQGTVVLSG
jgi:hypothetical protein